MEAQLSSVLTQAISPKGPHRTPPQSIAGLRPTPESLSPKQKVLQGVIYRVLSPPRRTTSPGQTLAARSCNLCVTTASRVRPLCKKPRSPCPSRASSYVSQAKRPRRSTLRILYSDSPKAVAAAHFGKLSQRGLAFAADFWP